jgi:hypothetical protein
MERASGASRSTRPQGTNSSRRAHAERRDCCWAGAGASDSARRASAARPERARATDRLRRSLSRAGRRATLPMFARSRRLPGGCSSAFVNPDGAFSLGCNRWRGAGPYRVVAEREGRMHDREVADRRPFEAMFDEHFAAVLAYAVACADLETAADAAAEVFLVAWSGALSCRRSRAAGCWLSPDGRWPISVASTGDRRRCRRDWQSSRKPRQRPGTPRTRSRNPALCWPATTSEA